MARRVVRIRGNGVPTVSVFELADDWKLRGLHIMEFPNPTREWAEFVLNNRDRGFRDLSSPSCNRLNQYDIVCGLVADDAIVVSFQLYQDGRIDIDGLVERLRYAKLSDQYSFHTPGAICLLTFKGYAHE